MTPGNLTRTLPPMHTHKRFTYANVVATLALVFAMSGGAIAANHYLITSTKQISPKVIKKLKGKAGPAGKQGAAGPAGPAGKEGQAGKEGLAGKDGKDGKEGKEGAPGSALAYAHILGNGKVDPAATKNVAESNVSNPFTGVYCFSGLSFTPHNAVATIDWSSTKNGIIESISVATGASAQSMCGSTSAQAGVLTGEVEPGNFTKGLARSFYVTFN
jgi:Collagen triple helix repeat (20 copies)